LQAQFTNVLAFHDSTKMEAVPIYRVTNAAGAMINPSHDPNFDQALLIPLSRQCLLP
jgi:hypothetical protein